MSSKNEVLYVLKEQQTSKYSTVCRYNSSAEENKLVEGRACKREPVSYPNLALHENVLNGKRGERISAQKKRIISLKL